MLSLDDRLALLQADLLADPPAFIMARELPFAIFRYDPHTAEESEWLVRRKVQLLATQIQNQTQQPAVILSLADLFWRSIEESEEIESLYTLEREHSFSVAERQVHLYLSDPEFRPLCDLLREEEKRLPKNTRVLFLVHATVFAPSAYRISSLFEQLHRSFRTPAVLFYPGSWNHTLNYMGMRSDDQTLGSYRVKIYGRES
ncbi:MAG: BREX protein BrxB domain-containing protein [Halothiobacillaceae bacterium]